jgi:hypothetical protein
LKSIDFICFLNSKCRVSFLFFFSPQSGVTNEILSFVERHEKILLSSII